MLSSAWFGLWAPHFPLYGLSTVIKAALIILFVLSPYFFLVGGIGGGVVEG